MKMKLTYFRDDGGRKNAGYATEAGDCFCRAVCIATGMGYEKVYNMINFYAKNERKGKRKKTKSSARTGVFIATAKKMMKDLGWIWVPTMKIGQGCKVHLRADELPEGRIICRVSKHFTAVIDGVIHDTFDPSRDGKRCVYGFWYREDDKPDVITEMRKELVPRGTAPLVRMFLNDNTYVNTKFATECIDAIEHRLLMSNAGLLEELNPLEKLAIMVLKDSSYIKD